MNKTATAMNETTMSNIGGSEEAKKVKELEKRVVKLRQENSQLSSQVDKAMRLLEREIGEAVDIEMLSKEES